MEQKHLLSPRKVQSVLFTYTESIIYIVCVSLIYLFFNSALIVLVEIFVLVSCQPLELCAAKAF